MTTMLVDSDAAPVTTEASAAVTGTKGANVPVAVTSLGTPTKPAAKGVNAASVGNIGGAEAIGPKRGEDLE